MVNRRKKGITAFHSKLTSHRLRTATIGTHAPSRTRSSRHMNGETVGFSSPRKQRRASRGYVDTIMPSTTSRESGSNYAKRVSRREFTQEIQRRARIRRIVIALVCCVAVVCVAVGVGAATFFGSLDGKLGLRDSDASSALVAAKDNGAFYTVVAADLDVAGSPNAVEGPDAIALVRVDAASKAATIVSIPANTQVTLKDGNTHQLREATVQRGDASLVSAVSNLMGVDVSHYVEIDAAGIAQLTDVLGGIEVEVPEEVDDPTAGDVYLQPGVQTLDGQAALTFLRAGNFADGLKAQAANQRSFLTALSLRLLGDGTLGFLTTLDSVGGAFQTDVSALDALSLADALRGMGADAVSGALVPGYDLMRDEVQYYAVPSEDRAAMMQLVEAGEDPADHAGTASVDPGSFSITVRNGSGVTGGAAQIAEALTSRGFNVAETGNTDSFAYSETLVVYKDETFLPAAQTAVSALGAGRTVNGGDFYTFDTDVLVVLGQDWKPAA